MPYGFERNKKTAFKPIWDKKKIAVIASLLILGLAVAAAYTLFVNKPARRAYLEAEGKNIKKYTDQLKTAYKDFYADQKPYMDSRYKKRTEFTADIRSDSEKPFGIANAENIFDVLRRCKLIIDSNNDPTSKESLTKVNLLLERAPLIDAEIYTRDRELGFTVPVLLPGKYFTADRELLDQVYQRFNLPLRPKKTFKASEAAGALKLDDRELEGIIQDYGSFLSGLIKDKDVQYGDKVSVKVGNEDKTGRQIILTLGGEETKKLIGEAARKFSADEVLSKLTYGNYAGMTGILDEAALFQVYPMLEEMGYLKLNDILKDYLNVLGKKPDREAFKNALEALDTDVTYPEGLKMVVVVDGSGNILDRKLTTLMLRGPEERISIDLHSGTNDSKKDDFNKGFAQVEIGMESPGEDKLLLGWGINSNLDVNSRDESRKGEIAVTHTRKKNGRDEFGIKLDMKVGSKIDEATLKRNSTTEYELAFRGEDPGISDRFFGTMVTDSWRNNKQKTRNSNSSIELNFDLPTLGVKNTALKFDLKNEDRFDVDFSLPQVKEADTVNLNKATDADLQKVQGDMMKSFGAFYLQNKPVVDAILGTE